MILAGLLDSQTHLTAGCRLLATHCIDGLRVNRSKVRADVEGSASLAAALLPALGYERATAIATRAAAGPETVVELVRREGLLSPGWERELLGPSDRADQERFKR